MTLTKMQAMLGVATGSLIVIGAIVDNRLTDERRFAALDTRLAKIESAVKALDSAQPDERYRTLIKELMAYENNRSAPEAKTPGLHTFGGNCFPADAGAAADAPSSKPPQ